MSAPSDGFRQAKTLLRALQEPEARLSVVPAPEPTPPPPPLLGSTVVAQAYERTVQRRPNVATATRELVELKAQEVDLAEARDAREEYRGTMRSD